MTVAEAPPRRTARVGDTLALTVLTLLALAFLRAMVTGKGTTWLRSKFLNRAPTEPTMAPGGFGIEPETPGTAYLRDPIGGGWGTTPGPFGCFGYDRGDHRHEGLDINIPVGWPVGAPAAGTVTLAGFGSAACGLALAIDHGSGLSTHYCHLSALACSVGDRVYRGQVVARTGGLRGSYGAGNSAGPHLHFAVYRSGVAVDPAGLIGRTCQG
jgi:murein DD-endopeptidase MepM/ murein hydrolase activator NlpD